MFYLVNVEWDYYNDEEVYNIVGYSESIDVVAKNGIQNREIKGGGVWRIYTEDQIDDKITGDEPELKDLPFDVLYRLIAYTGITKSGVSINRTLSYDDFVRADGQKRVILDYYRNNCYQFSFYSSFHEYDKAIEEQVCGKSFRDILTEKTIAISELV